ncbi:hypothetical protein [Mitsuaria sp. 7]|uniref:hypothetical protein n=1 Tax=Mitsuaria sp. 7 TaxID=1658665 RepID=UPI0007DD1567|nr:hypothetical protein [Mitsuaria sp. 7]ANH68538.1 hypothetical protein ABE85_14925 [Mitsuaria sp. 7]
MDQPPQDGPYLTFRVMGLPFFLHWTLPALGSAIGLVLMMATGGPSLPIFFWCSLTCIVLVLIHELGHAAAAKAMSLEVHGIVLAGAGGWCMASEPRSITSAVIVYAGGILAQILVLLLVGVSLWIFGPPDYLPLNCAVIVLTLGNVLLLLSALIPRGQNDGAIIVMLLREARRARHDPNEKSELP